MLMFKHQKDVISTSSNIIQADSDLSVRLTSFENNAEAEKSRLGHIRSPSFCFRGTELTPLQPSPPFWASPRQTLNSGSREGLTG